MQSYQKLIKNHTKSFVFTILDISQKKFDDCMNINSVNPFYLGIAHSSGYIEKKGANKYLVFDSTDANKELLKKLEIKLKK